MLSFNSSQKKPQMRYLLEQVAGASVVVGLSLALLPWPLGLLSEPLVDRRLPTCMKPCWSSISQPENLVGSVYPAHKPIHPKWLHEAALSLPCRIFPHNPDGILIHVVVVHTLKVARQRYNFLRMPGVNPQSNWMRSTMGEA